MALWFDGKIYYHHSDHHPTNIFSFLFTLYIWASFGCMICNSFCLCIILPRCPQSDILCTKMTCSDHNDIPLKVLLDPWGNFWNNFNIGSPRKLTTGVRGKNGSVSHCISSKIEISQHVSLTPFTKFKFIWKNTLRQSYYLTF